MENRCECCDSVEDVDFLEEADSYYCYDCYCDKYTELCPLCEEHYEKTTNPEDTYFVITPEGEEMTGVQAGIYTATDFPIYSAYLGGLGPTSLHADNFKLLRACDITSMLRKLGEDNEDLGAAEFICAACANRFSRTENYIQVQQNWCNNKLHRNISERGIIQAGA